MDLIFVYFLAANVLLNQNEVAIQPALNHVQETAMNEKTTYMKSHQAEEELKALNARFINNFVTNDVPSHDAILHEKFLYISGKGMREDRATYLKKWATGFDPEVIIYWDTRDELITVIGNVALVRSTNKSIERIDGKETTYMMSYTDTYIFENGQWQCIQAHLTPVAREYWPDDSSIISVYIKGKLQEKSS